MMIEKKVLDSYKDYGKVLCITNGTVEAYVTVDVGPRIIRYGKVGGQNFMRDERNAFDPKDDSVFTDFFGAGRSWENLGGHRIWASPEAYPDTYYPDNVPYEYELTDKGAIFTPAAEVETGLAKQLEITMAESGTDMQVAMRIKNISEATKTFSIWGLTVSAQGGDLIIPLNTKDTGLLHNRQMSIWPYTDLRDERIYFGNRYVTVHQDKNASTPLKLGFDLGCGAVYYALNNEVFCKKYKTEHPAAYPDNGCSFETYTCDQFIEVESLSPLKNVASGETSKLVEHWSITDKAVDVDFKNDDSIAAFLETL